MHSDEPNTQVLDGRRLRRRGDRVLTPTFTMIEGPGIGVLHVLDPSRRAHRLGRGDEADVQIQAPSVSRYHATAIVSSRDDERCVRIEDNGSTNGVKVNGNSVPSAWLDNGDKVRLGDVLLRFQWMTDDEIQYASGLSTKLLEAARDPLTGLLTRAFIEDRLPSRLREAEVRGQQVCGLLMDLDHFKRINDDHGHIVGDSVIRRTARVIQDSLRDADIGIRYGGEEFLVIFFAAGLSEGVDAAARLRDQVRELSLDDLVDGLRVTVSQGLALRARNETVTGWIDRADQALYDAKRGGRDRLRLAESPNMFIDVSDDDDGTTESALAPPAVTMDADGD